MIRFFPHAPEDDLAPLDYRSVSSVSEGVRVERSQRMHRPRNVLPVDDYGIPDNPFAPPPETQQPSQPRRRRVDRYAAEEPAVYQAQDGSQYEQPAHVEIPDWLRVAQQNHPALQERPQAPRVQTAQSVDALGRPVRRAYAKPTASPYEEAGYPQELLDAQRTLEAEQAAQPMRRYHGAQQATRPDRRPTHARTQPQQPAPPPPMKRKMQEAYHIEEEEYDENRRELPAWMTRVPWLGILAFLTALAAVVVWVVGSNFEKQTQIVLTGRAAQAAAILEAHPLKYEQLISEKASKYNLHPAFVAAIMLNESSFRPDATSSVDARGLMQLMDDTAGWIHGKMDLPTPYSFDDLYDAGTNVEYGCWYLHFLSERFRGDPILVAAAFHAGQGEVQNWLNDSRYSADQRTIELENMIDGPTKQYVTRVLRAYAAYKRLYYGG